VKLSISNIAWRDFEDIQIYELMQKYGFTGLEVAPGRVSPDGNYSQEFAKVFRDKISRYDISVVSMQSLHFGRNDLQLFESQSSRNGLLELSKERIDFAKHLGSPVLVFGSPKNRSYKESIKEKVDEIAMSFFANLGDYAASNNITICVEANPSVYGTNFLTTTKQASRFVRRLNSPGIKLNMDLGTMTINGEDYQSTIRDNVDIASHFHISEPMLEHVYEKSYIKTAINTLAETEYNGWLSIEMKPLSEESSLDFVEQSLSYIKDIYGNR